MRKYRRWLFALALLILVAGGLCAFAFGPTLMAAPEVRPPYPTARLISERTSIDTRGFHTVRVYYVPAEMRDVLRWYWEEDVWANGRGAGIPRTFNYSFYAPLAGWPFPNQSPSRSSNVYFADRNGYIEVVTDSRYYWRSVEP